MIRLISLVLCLLSIKTSFAQAQPVSTMEGMLDTAYFAKKNTGHIKVDGVLSEEIWQHAQKATHFIQNFPNDSMLSAARSEVMVTYDDKFIYFAGTFYNSEKHQKYVTPSLKRDFRGEANDAIVISIDPFMDRLNSFSFGINPFGVQREGLVVNGGVVSEDLSLSWDNKWYSEAKIHEDYWTMEMAIPLVTLRFRNGAKKWLVNFYRLDSHNGERSGWAKIPNQFAMISLAFSTPLEFETPIQRKGPNISLIPFVSPGITRMPIATNSNKFKSKSNQWLKM